ncbi:MAG: hypothetical protein II849_10460, partial [Bacteroidales bacterium]|nr:hypothetical protein [Bacteroidales bacterium]
MPRLPSNNANRETGHVPSLQAGTNPIPDRKVYRVTQHAASLHSQLPTHHSPLITHHSPLITHHSS